MKYPVTYSAVGSKIGLDVNVLGGTVQVTATNLDIRTLSASDDSVAIGDGDFTFLAGQASASESFPVVIADDNAPLDVTQSGTWNINNVSGTVSDVRQTNAANFRARIEGTGAVGSVGGNPVMIGGVDFSSQKRTILETLTLSGLNVLSAVPTDLGLNSPDFTTPGESYSFSASTNNTKANVRYLKVLTDGTLLNRSSDTEYETVAASQTDKALGATGATGDYLKRVIVSVATSATGTCSIKDGAGSAITLTPANTPIGVYVVDIGAVSTAGAWQVTTGAGATAIGIGRFT